MLKRPSRCEWSSSHRRGAAGEPTVEELKTKCVTGALELALVWPCDKGEEIPERAQVTVTPAASPAPEPPVNRR